MALSDVLAAFGMGGKTPTAQPTTTNSAPGTQQTTTNNLDPSKTGNTTVPGDGTVRSDGTGPAAIPKAGEGAESPLEKFKDIWQKPENPAKQPSLVPEFKIDPQKLNAAAKSIDFKKAVTPEVLERLKKGGDDTAILDALNEVGQAAFAQSIGATTKIVESAMQNQANSFHNSVMPEILRKHEISQAISANNKLAENPATAPIFALVKDAVTAKFPAATPDEIKQHTNELMGGLAEEMIRASGRVVTDAPKVQANARRDTDWGSFFEIKD
jgi:hypothetical protein